MTSLLNSIRDFVKFAREQWEMDKMYETRARVQAMRHTAMRRSAIVAGVL